MAALVQVRRVDAFYGMMARVYHLLRPQTTVAGTQLTPNRRVAHYVLLEKLGAGGLGEVWKAHDETLKRLVALKFVAGEPGSSGTGRDLMREARAASALNHPNIVTVFEAGDSEHGAYLAMELVEGETLRAHLDRGKLAVAEALDLMEQVARGLAVAHANGIVHRDLKPENIMIRPDGYVKLLDFGLAKRLPWAQTAGAASVTAASTDTGQISGTFNYMSPEQARGISIGPASDVFAFGIILHEMLTGMHPFRGLTVMDTLQNIIGRQLPEPPGVTASVAEIIQTALKKDPAERYTDAGALLQALRTAAAARVAVSAPPAETVVAAPAALPGAPQPFQRVPAPRWMQALGVTLSTGLLALAFVPDMVSSKAVAAQTEVPKVTSVAVLNFRAPAGDPNLAVFGEALAEELSSALAKSGLQVSAQSAVQALPAAMAPQDAGKQLNVDAVFAGSIRPSGQQIKLHVELVNSRNAFQIWSDSLSTERAASQAEEKVAGEIVTRMRAALAGRGPQ